MATTQSKTFQAAPDQVWVAVVKLITSAGYPVKETNAAARQLVYQASGGGWAWAQSVKVSVVGVAEGETLVTVNAEAAGQETLTEGPSSGSSSLSFSTTSSNSFPSPPVSRTTRMLLAQPGASVRSWSCWQGCRSRLSPW
jgi:hypothetical protein